MLLQRAGINSSFRAKSRNPDIRFTTDVESVGDHAPPAVAMVVSVISGPCELVFLASLVTQPQGDGAGGVRRMTRLVRFAE